MQDVIFAGGKGQSRRNAAEVEVVIDNADGQAGSEFSEISITRHISRDGDAGYRLNGARCRLADVIEALADTGLGREMHSVISQGRVEALVSSKPRDRRLLIEEAAGLGKHRKRRHRAQLKLDRTRENLDRALDVEREARSRIRPLKAQAEAAERQAKMARQADELNSQILRSDLGQQKRESARADQQLAEARKTLEALETRLESVRKRRAIAEERIAVGEEGRRELAERLAESRAALERVKARAESVGRAERELRSALAERQLRLEGLGEQSEPDQGTAERIAELQARLAEITGVPAQSAEGADVDSADPVAAAARARDEAAAELPKLREGGREGDDSVVTKGNTSDIQQL
jgi:chromosome segregation protein